MGVSIRSMIVHREFEAVAAGYPDKEAVRDSARSLTYSQLNLYANRVARLLLKAGLQSQEVVAVYSERSVEYVVLIIGIMKAGGVFLPLGTAFPGGRISSILCKTKPRAILTTTELENELTSKIGPLDPGPAPEILVVGAEGETIRQIGRAGARPLGGRVVQSDGNPDVKVKHDDACYIITTSGSTGEPKAILGSHKGIAHFVRWEIEEFRLTNKIRGSMLSAITFDASFRDIFVPLISGGSVYIPDDPTLQDSAKLVKWFSAMRITLAHMVPTLFRAIVTELQDNDKASRMLPDLEFVLAAGEPLYGQDVMSWRELSPRARLVNLYGPSETTMVKLFYRTEDKDFSPEEMIPIGRPISDTDVLIINNGRPCGIGESGEIHIRTPYMTKGYYNDSEGTRSAFIQNPLVNDREDILYKTGDQGEFLPDMNVRFLGRLDGQIKVRGVRIESGEIETILRQHPEIRQAAVSLKKDNFGLDTLVGYIVLENTQTITIENLRRFLREKLPDYMIPAAFIFLDALPLTYSGKIDRNALPEPGRSRPKMEVPYISPVSSSETVLSEVWRDVLNLDNVGVNDNFFDLGGNSIIAARAVGQIKDRLKIELPLLKVYEYPKIRQLAEYLDNKPIPGLNSDQARYRAQKRKETLSGRDRLRKGRGS